MFLGYWIISIIIGLLLLRKVVKLGIDDKKPIPSTGIAIGIAIMLIPIANTIVSIIIGGFFIDMYLSELSQERLTRFWKRVFFISTKK